MTLDGDLPAIVLPVASYQTVMNDPFGLNVLLHDSVYAAPNRFFVHQFIMTYFRNVPIWLQKFLNPVDSLYVAAALARTLTQFVLVFLIACYATGKMKFWNLNFLLASALAIPLFQNYRYYSRMAIVDYSVTYTFFYAMSLILVLVFFLPFFNAFLGRREFNFNIRFRIGWILLSVVIAFSGPLNAPVMLLTGGSVLVYTLCKVFKKSIQTISPGYVTVLVIISSATAFCLYSYYIGMNNLENYWQELSLSERYSRLPAGLRYLYFDKPAQPVLICIVLFNSFLIWRLKKKGENEKILTCIKIFLGVSLLYILLLPLGGYRIYRENIVRFDTIMPITLGLVLFYVYTTVLLFQKFYASKKFLIPFLLLIAGINVFYINRDLGLFPFNTCERSGLMHIAKSEEDVVLVTQDCTIMNWEKMTDPNDSKSKGEMLYFWNITTKPKLYYQK